MNFNLKNRIREEIPRINGSRMLMLLFNLNRHSTCVCQCYTRVVRMQPEELSLKVLRLSKPSLVSNSHNYYEIRKDDGLPAFSGNQNGMGGLAGDAGLREATANDPTADVFPVVEGAQYAASSLLALPTAFGNIYLGETFVSLICINNETSQKIVTEVGLKTEIQSGTQRITLQDNLGTIGPASTPTHHPAISASVSAASAQRVTLHPAQTTQLIVTHEIKEMGSHILVCSVHYTVDGERKYFRRFFKFQVLNPLAVKTKINTLDDGRILLEAQIQNVTTTHLTLDKMRFEVSELFNCTDLNTVIQKKSDIDKNPSSVFAEGDDHTLNTRDSRQYLFALTPKMPNDPVARSTPYLGRLDIVWKIGMGQMGKLQTAQLARKVPPVEALEVLVRKLPEKIFAEEPFSIVCEIKSNHPEKIRLSLSGVKNKMGSVLLAGCSEKFVGLLNPGDVSQVELSFFPLYPGLHKVSGIRLMDAISGTTKDLDNLTTLFVSSF